MPDAPRNPDDRRLAPRRKPVSGPVEDYEGPDEDPDGPSKEDLARFGDVTIKCPECGTELFDDVALCWSCGRPVGPGAPGEGKVPTWAVVVAAVLIIGFLYYVFANVF